MYKLWCVRIMFAALPLIAAEVNSAVVVERTTQENPEWAQVTAALVAKHHAALIIYDEEVETALPAFLVPPPLIAGEKIEI